MYGECLGRMEFLVSFVLCLAFLEIQKVITYYLACLTNIYSVLGVCRQEGATCYQSHYIPSATPLVNVHFVMMDLEAAVSVIVQPVTINSIIACKVWAVMKFVKLL